VKHFFEILLKLFEAKENIFFLNFRNINNNRREAVAITMLTLS
jgi:hypothetical protein